MFGYNKFYGFEYHDIAETVVFFTLFVGWCWRWFGLADAGFLWEKNTVDWLNKPSWNQQANMVFEVLKTLL